MSTCLVYPTVGYSASFSSLCGLPRSLKWHQIYSEHRSWSPGRSSDTTGADGMRLEGEPAEPAAFKVRGEPCCFQRCSGQLSESQEKLNQEGLVRSLFLFIYTWNDLVTLWEVPKESDWSAWGGLRDGVWKLQQEQSGGKGESGSPQVVQMEGSHREREPLQEGRQRAAARSSACLSSPWPSEEACLPATPPLVMETLQGVFPAKGRLSRGFPHVRYLYTR